ncbi:unnamed protein product [Spodoptera exigua]|nr:unnamed protein product [Spodoptera exigua]
MESTTVKCLNCLRQIGDFEFIIRHYLIGITVGRIIIIVSL